MAKILYTIKGKMTQIFDENGHAKAGTVLVARANTVVQVKTQETDGYQAVQVGFGKRAEKNIAKAQQGHMGDLGRFAHLGEFRGNFGLEKGAVIDANTFAVGDTVVGITKGKGFQGGVKRHGFAGAPRSHGHKQSERRPGSIGMRWPQRVLKGMRMAGRMGSDTVTVKNLKVLAVNAEENVIIVSGAIPGRPGTLVSIRGN